MKSRMTMNKQIDVKYKDKFAQKVGKINIFGGTFFFALFRFVPTFEHFILA